MSIRRIREVGWSLGILAIAMLGAPHAAVAAEAVDVLGGRLEWAGFLNLEARHKISNGPNYLTHLQPRLQLEATLRYEDLGLLDEMSFTTIMRPQFDLAHWYGDELTEGHVGRDADRPSYLGREFNFENDPLGFSGFDPVFGNPPNTLSTGGLVKNVRHGIWDADVLEEFETIGDESFPLTAPISDRNLDCGDCRDVDNDHTDIALGRTDSSGVLYPFREIYADFKSEDWWVRIGKQQVVWGKTDFFRLQDIINPVDFGPHFFFDSFEDIRIPQWILSTQYRPGSIGPVTDIAAQLVWNFDEFRAVGLGNPTEAWAGPFGKEKGVFALFNSYFSREPCVSAAEATAPGQVCQPGDGRLPSGFGVPLGLREEVLPDWKFKNTEIGLRLEGRLGPVRLAITDYWGWQDTPVFRLRTLNYLTASGGGFFPDAAANDALVAGLAEGILLPTAVLSPAQAARVGGPLAPAAAQQALRSGDAGPFLRLASGAQVDAVYKKVNTFGVAVDYFEERFTEIVFRIESSWTKDELVQNMRKLDWTDESDVIRFAIGMDRPTFIPFLNPSRTFFISAQIFNTIYLDHEGGDSDGFITTQSDNWIFTLFAQTFYMRDQLIPQAFVVFEPVTGSWVSGSQVEYLLSNNWSIAAGVNVIWGGRRNQSHDVGPFTSFTQDGNFAQLSAFGYARQGLGAVRNNDEAFLRIRYRF